MKSAFDTNADAFIDDTCKKRRKGMKNTLKAVAALICAAIVLVSCSDNSKTELEQNTGDYDFIYEVINNSSAKLIIKNYIRDVNASDYKAGIVIESSEVVLAVGETYQFKYNTTDLCSTYTSSNYYLGCYFYPTGKLESGGWENVLSCSNWKHTVTVLDSSTNYITGVNYWNKINISSLVQSDRTYDFIYEVVNNTSGTLSIANYLRNSSINNYYDSFIARSAEFITLAVGETYQYKYNLTELKKTYLGSSLSLGCYFYPSGKWQCSGWENDLTTTTNQKNTVTVTDASSDYCMNGENTWSNLQ